MIYDVGKLATLATTFGVNDLTGNTTGNTVATTGENWQQFRISDYTAPDGAYYWCGLSSTNTPALRAWKKTKARRIGHCPEARRAGVSVENRTKKFSSSVRSGVV
jgi:hypothetical protein